MVGCSGSARDNDCDSTNYHYIDCVSFDKKYKGVTMSEKKAKEERKDQPKLTQEQKVALECAMFMDTRMSGRPLPQAVQILVGTVIHILQQIEEQGKIGKGMMVKQFGDMLSSTGESMFQKPAEIVEDEVVTPVEEPLEDAVEVTTEKALS